MIADKSSRLRQPSKVAHQPLKVVNIGGAGNISSAGNVSDAKQLKRKASSADAPSLPIPAASSRVNPGVAKARNDNGPRKMATSSGTVAAKTRTTSVTVISSTRVASVRSSALSKPTGRFTSSQSSRPLSAVAKAAEPEVSERPVAAAGPIKMKKRPAWDTKGRLEDMEEAYSTLNSRLQDSSSSMQELQGRLESDKSRIHELEEFRKSLETKVEVKEAENKDVMKKYAELQHNLETKERHHGEAIETLKSRHQLEIQQVQLSKTALERESASLAAELKRANGEIEGCKDENSQLKSAISQQSTSIFAMESDNRALKLRLERTEETLKTREARIHDLETNLEDREQLVAQLEQRIRDEETVRRKLHNTIQELKGNIRVFCRIRPLLGSEKDMQGGIANMDFPDQDGKEIELHQSLESSFGSSVAKAYPFSFDRVFQQNATQTDVFEEISQLVQSALDGYNVCIFAYGQTGSGKTYTMEGPNAPSSETLGMIPRAVQQIYDSANQLKSKGWSYIMEGQFLEIYNESINDLLGNGLDFDKKKHEVKHDKGSRTTVTDITTVILDSPSKVAQLLKKATANRAVGATNMNERSSRSHSVFTLRLAGHNSITEETCEGVLNLIDLAGSERLSSSGSTGDRLKETQAINKSLSCLGDVISALATQKEGGHIPYRNSKLTYLLQNSLGGNSKTLMFVNISPLAVHLQETLCSLRFATKVNSCQIGTATAKKVSKS